MADEATTAPETAPAPAETPKENPPAAPAEAATAPAESTEKALEASSATILGEEDQAKAEGADGEASAAPEKYEAFFDADGKAFTQEETAGFAEAAREIGLSQEKAQKLFGAIKPLAEENVRKKTAEFSRQWAEASRNDPEIGGANFESVAGVAKTAYRQFTTPELRSVLDATGLGNHPEMIRLFYKVGKAMSPDTGVTGGSSAPAEIRRRRYPKSNMVVDG